MNNKLSYAALALLAFGISGCSSVAERPAPVAPQQLEPAPAAPPAADSQNEPALPEESAVEMGSFEPDLLFRLLAAELATQRGDISLALREYKQAAFQTRDPAIVEQATRLATYAKADVSELQALAELWVEVDPKAPEPRQALAMITLQQGEVAKTVEQLEYLLANAPGFNYMSVVTLLGRQPNSEAALQVMQVIADNHAGSHEAQFAYAHLAVRAGQPELALQKVDLALQLKPGWSDAVILRAHVLNSLGRTPEALAYLDQQLQQELVDNVSVRLTYAQLLLRENQLEQGWRQLQKLVEAQPADGNIIYMSAVTSMQLNKVELAEQQLQSLLQLNGRNHDARFQLGRIAEHRKDYPGAIQWYQSVTGGQFHFAAQLQLVSLMARQGELEAALDRLAEVEPKSADEEFNIVMLKGELLFRAGRYQQAMDLYTESLSQFENNPRLLYGRSLTAEKLGMWQQSEQDLRTMLEQDADNTLALNALGYSLADRGERLEEALGYLEKAYSLQPEDPAITDSLGWVHYRLGNFELAIQYLRQALDKMYDPEIAAHLGEVLWMTGEREQARKIWQKAREQHPDHEVLQKTLERFGQ